MFRRYWVRDRGRGDSKGDEEKGIWIKRHRDIDKHKKGEIEETMRQIAKRNETESDWERGVDREGG